MIRKFLTNITSFCWKRRFTLPNNVYGCNNVENQSRSSIFARQPGYVHSMCTKSSMLDQRALGKLAEQYETFLLDLDGTLWGVDHVTALPGIAKAVDTLRRLNKKLIFVTNNSLHANSLFIDKFKEFGFEASEDDVFGVAYASAIYLKYVLKTKGTVYVIGSHGMAQELDKAGIKHFGIGPDPDVASWNPDDLKNMEFKDDVDTVLVGYDKHLHYNKIFKAASYLSNKGCHYVATNDVEIAFQLSKDRVQPVTGTIVKAVSTAASREPKVVGKPHRLLFDCVEQKYPDINKKQTVVIGDSLKADIAFANNVGIDSILVLTGVSALQNISQSGISPTYVLDSFSRFGSL